MRPVLLCLLLAAAVPVRAGWLPEERLTARADSGDYTTDSNGRAIAADPDGNLHVVWCGECGPENQIWYRWRDAMSGEWSVAETISSEPTGACLPSVAAGDSGNVHVVWQIGAVNDGTGIRYRQRDAVTGVWGQVESIAQGSHCERPSVACREPGLVVATWEQQSPGLYRNVFCSRRVGETWLAAEQATPEMIVNQTSGSVGVDDSTRIGVLWRAAPSGYSQVMFRSRDSSGWLAVDTLMRVNGSSCGQPTLWVEGNGKVHAAWKTGSTVAEHRIVYRQRSGGVWRDTVSVPRPSNTEQLQPSLCADEFGQPHVAWCCDSANLGQKVYYSSADTSGHGWTPPIRVAGAVYGRYSPSITGASGSEVAVVWTDERHQAYNPDVYCRRTGILRDIATTAVIAPAGIVDSGDVVVPRGVFANQGEQAESFDVWFRADSVLSRRTVTALLPGQADTVEFDSLTATVRGWHSVACSAWVRDDTCRANDVIRDSFFVRVLDVAAESIISPRGRIRPEPLTPSVLVANPGNCSAAFQACLRVRDSAGVISYVDSVSVILSSGESRPINLRTMSLQQGRYSARCSLAVGDLRPENDTTSCEVVVYEPDVVVSELLWPPALVDSGTSGQPTFRVENRGVLATDVWAWFGIGADYRDSMFVTNLAAGADSVVEFSTWTALDRGWNSCRCSLLVVPDSVCPETRVESTFVRVLDAAADAILEPAGSIAADTVWPRALVSNPGNVDAGGFCRMVFVDDSGRTVYADSVALGLAAGASDTAEFRSWAAVPGSHVARCSVAVDGDQQPGNDSVSARFTVCEPNIGVVAIEWPPSVVDSGTVGRPAARIRNYGQGRTRFACCFEIGGCYADTVVGASVGPGIDTVIDFREWTALLRGLHPLGCSLLVSGGRDADSPVAGSVFVRVIDLAALEILAPSDTQPSGPVVPLARFANQGNVQASASCRFRIGAGAAVIRAESVTVVMPVEADTTVRFGAWEALPGTYWCDAVIETPGDLVPANDSVARAFVVESLPVEPWERLADVPDGPRGAPVRDGGGMLNAGGQVLVLKGCNTAEWFSYSTATGGWQRLADVPGGASRRRVKSGAALATDGQANVFLVKGRGTREFLGYDIQRDTWESLPSLPAGTRPVRYGADACFVPGDTGRLFLLKGSSTLELLVYWVGSREWHAQRPLPSGRSGNPARHGTGLAVVGGRVFAAKGGSNEFYEFFPARDSWAERAEVPSGAGMGRSRRVRRGAALGTDGERFVYLFRGAGCNQTWAYDADGDSWFRVEDIPRGERRRKVGRGAALCWCGDRLYALKGGGCRELWSYLPRSGRCGPAGRPEPGAALVSRIALPVVRGRDRALVRLDRPSGGQVELSLYDACGRCVLSRQVGVTGAGEVAFDVRDLAAGTYLVRLEGRDWTRMHKLVVRR